MFARLFTISILSALPWFIASKLWSPSSDPLPPLQPKECSYETYNSQIYYDSTGGVVLNVQVAGYEFLSYYYQSIQSVVSGSNFGIPLYQTAFNNYTSQKNMLAQYNTQTCAYSDVEGNSPYPGYDYYQQTLLGLYSSGVPVYFETITLPTYGLCYKYYATVPWDNPALPRNIIYTVIFQVSTSYLIQYDLTGTEYCCGQEANFYCPNEGLCNDGSAPQLIYANTNQTISQYQIYSAPSLWPKGFFGAYCPFSATTNNINNDDNTEKLKDEYFILFVTFVALFGVTLCILLGVTFYFLQQQKQQKQPADAGTTAMNALHI